jgi:hypothetical protein
MESNKGFKDIPLSNRKSDSFEITKYVDGLVSFIKECDTPMTIAIQGDWGSGKTSMMNMILNDLGDSVASVYFNTWQYSQFNMGDELSISFLGQLIDELQKKSEDKTSGTKAKKAVNFIKLAFRRGGVLALDTLVGGEAAKTLDEFLNKMDGSEMDLPQAIKALKKDFQDCVEEATKGKGRVVFFVDDLDRLNPGKAVELLEVLKLFMDCEGCVFVLAIDYNVVSKGVKEKYGDMLGEEKGRSFFDKIIQVPFKMPVALYEVNSFVQQVLLGLEIYKKEKDISEKDMSIFVNLIRTSISCNPRAMKRLFNAYLLLMKIYKGEIGEKKTEQENIKDKKILFAILCMQQAFEELYDYLMNNIADLSSGELLSGLTKPEAYVSEENGDDQVVLIEKSRIPKATTFMTAFLHAIDEDGDDNLSTDECDSFINILRKSKVTSSGTSEYQNASPEVVAFRAYNRGVVTEINKRFAEVVKTMPGVELFKVYQVRTERPGWNYQDCCGYVDMPGGYHVDYKIRTDLSKTPPSAEVVIFAGPRYGKDYSYFDNTAKDIILALAGFSEEVGGPDVTKQIPFDGEVACNVEYSRGIEAIVVPEILKVLEALKK